MFAKVDSLVRDGTLTPELAGRVYARVRDGGARAGATSVIPADADRRRWTLLLRGVGAAAVLGAALLLGALLVVTQLADQEDFNWKAFVVLLVAAIAVSAVGVAAALFGGIPDHRRWIASALVASGVFATALVLHILLRDQDWSTYLVGALLLVGGVAAYLWLRGAALTVVIVLGGLLVLSQLISDIVDDGADSTLGPGIAFTVYGLVVVAAGWRFSSRHVTGLLGGIIALVGMLQVIYLSVFLSFGSSFVPEPDAAGTGGDSTDLSIPDFNGDLWTSLVIGLLVCVGLAALYAYSDYVGYLVLAFVGAALLTFSALSILQTDNRLWISVIFCAIGGLLLAAAVLRELLARGTGRRRASTYGGPGGGNGPGGYAGQPPGYPGYPYPQQQPYGGAPGGQPYPPQPSPPYGGPPPPPA